MSAISQRVSVVIPTHNRAVLLEASLTSVISQSVKPCELLIVDDYGCKKTEELVARESSKSNIAISYIRKPSDPFGGASSLNYGVERSVGDVIAFLDDDDRWEPNYLERSLTKFRTEDAAVYGRLLLDDGHTVAPYKVLEEGLTRKTVWANLALYNPGAHISNLLIRRDVFSSFGGIDVSIYPASYDKDILISILDSGYNYSVNKDEGAIIFLHEGGTSLPSRDFAFGLWKFYKKHRKKNFRFTLRVRTYLRVTYFIFRSSRIIGAPLAAALVRRFI